MSYKIYLSYTHKDSFLAQDLARRLKETGVDVCSSQESSSDLSVVRHAIREKLRGVSEVVVLLTENSANSDWVKYEIGVADSLDIRVTPVITAEGIEESVPMIGKHFVRYADLTEYISRLKKRSRAA